METLVLIIHLILAVGLVGIVLLQRSEGGGLGMGSSGTMGGLLSTRASGNLLTRTTAILAGLFMITSLTLAILSGAHTKKSQSQLQSIIEESQTTTPVPSPSPNELSDRPAPAQ